MSLFDNPPLHDFPDRAVRQALLEHPGNLRDVVAQAVPDLVAQLDFDAREVVQPGFLLEDWREREADLLFLVPLRGVEGRGGRRVLICLLLEHQSRPDRLLPLRIAQVLATVRVEKEHPDRYRDVFDQALRHLGPLAEADRMRWRDLFWLLLSWAIQRRPDQERDNLTALASQAQQEAPAAVEAVTMTETVKKTWIQHLREEAERDLRQQVERDLRQQVERDLRQQVERDTLQRALIDSLSALAPDLPESVRTQVTICTDADRLRAAIVQARTWKSLDDFRL